MTDELNIDGLGDAGKNAIRALRDENASLRRQLKQFEGIDPVQIKTEKDQLKTQVEKFEAELGQTRQQLDGLRSENVQLKGYQEFAKAAAGKLDPNYVSLVWDRYSAKVQLSDDGVLSVGGESFDNAIASTLEQYPALKPISIGANQPSQKIQDDSTPAIPPTNFIDNLEAIATGKVTVQHDAL